MKEINDIKDIKEEDEENEMPFCTEPEDSENARITKDDEPCKI